MQFPLFTEPAIAVYNVACLCKYAALVHVLYGRHIDLIDMIAASLEWFATI